MDDHKFIKGKMKDLFGLPPKVISKLKYHIRYIYSNVKIKSLHSEMLHRLVIDIFINDYFPIISKNIHIDKYNQSVIMGGIAYNKNVPTKLPFLKVETNDIDLKIYTTDINYIDQNEKALIRVLSVFRFSIIIICLYLKQVLELIKYYTNNGFLEDHNKKRSIKHLAGGAKSRTIKNKFASKGILSSYGVLVQLKKRNEHNMNEVFSKLELTQMTYSEIYSEIMKIIDNPEILITNKITYNIRYGSQNKQRAITFSDSQIIYPAKEHPAFYSYYFMNNKKQIDKTITQLINEKIPIDKIIDTISCNNNCKYTSVDSLILDTTLMLSYADLLYYENLASGGKVLVPVGFLFKYYKYLTKYIRLFVIKKFKNGTLKDTYVNAAKRLWSYTWSNFNIKTSLISETDETNIEYKRLLNEFHQNLFINKSLVKDYSELKDALDEYSHLVYYINSSRALFKKVDSESKHTGKSIESITIQMAEQELSRSHTSMYHVGGGDLKLLDEISYDDMDLDNPEQKKSSTKSIKSLILSKLDKLFKEEIEILNSIKWSLRNTPSFTSKNITTNATPLTSKTKSKSSNTKNHK